MDHYQKMLKEFCDFWFKQKQYWFNQNDNFDLIIKKRYEYYLQPTFIEIIKTFIYSDPLNTELKYLYLGFVLICDQLVRHCERNNEYVIQNYTQKVVSFSKYIALTPTLLNIYNPEEQCFLMLPLRHSKINSLENNEFALETIKKLNKEKESQIYRRFICASLMRYLKLKNQQIVYVTDQENINEENPEMKNEENTEMKNIVNVLDTNSVKQIVFKNSIEHNEKIMKNLKNYIEKYKLYNFTISLSGGVDSMVLCYALKMLQKQYELQLKALHIDYNNRESSQYEAKMCILWCKLLNIPVYVRKIEEIQRTRDKDRDLYEKITKEIRFHMYELLEYNVVLGHNKDDTIENIFSNIIKKKNYDNLFGMEEQHFDRVTICRPFLEITKQEIYDFANKYEIPFVYDSTPKWSERGQKRDKLMPFLNSYDKRIITGLESVCKYTKNLSQMSNDFVEMMVNFEIEELNKKSEKEQVIATINAKITNYDLVLWKNAIITICKKYKLPYVSQKSIEISFEKVKSGIKKNKITLNQNLSIKLENKINIIYKYYL
jgi:tRNA(Ile)-lysidine synthetase-like protein